MTFRWLLVHFLPTVGFVLALALLSHILRERRSPTSTLAWLMAIIFIPYLGVPLYLMLGGRKMIRKIKGKAVFAHDMWMPGGDSQFGDTHFLEQDSGISPATAKNRITLVPKGEQAFQTILKLIGNARHSILLIALTH